ASNFFLEWNANFSGGDFGELLSRKVKLAGSLHGILNGPWRDLSMKVEPKFTEFFLNGQKLTNVRGNLVLSDRILAGAPIVSDQVSATGGIYFTKDKGDEFSDLKIETHNLDINFLFNLLGKRADETKTLDGKLFAQGFLRGPLSQPIGSGSVRVEDWTLKSDGTKGRAAKAKWATAGGELYFDSVEIKLSPESESLIGELSFDNKGLVDLFLQGSHLRVSHVLYLFDQDLGVQGFTDLSLDYQRNSPSLKAEIRLTETVMAGTFLKDSQIQLNWVADRMDFSAHLFGDSINLSGASTQNKQKRETSAKFKIFNFNAASLFRALANSRIEIPLEGSGSATFTQPRANERLLLPALLSEAGKYTGEIKVQKASIQRGSSVLQSVDPFNIKIGGSGTRFPRWEFPQLNIRSSENLLQMKGYYETAQNFSLETRGKLDLRAVAGLYAPFSRSEGLAAIDGVWDTRGFVGKMELSDGLITFQNSPLVIRNVEASIKSRGNTFDLTRLKGDLREGSISIVGGLTFDSKKISSAQFNVELQNTLLQPQQGVSFRASGPLRLQIKGDDGELSGRLTIKDGLYRKRLDVKADILKFLEPTRIKLKPSEEEESAWQKWKLNVQLVTEDPFNVRNNLAEGSANLNLLVLGTIGDPRLKGSISIVRGQFYYHNRQFILTSGSIQFTDQSSNIPNFDIRANTEISDYRISVQITGDANEQRIKYSSNPVASEKDILSLVSFGYRASDTDVKEQDPARSASFTGISFVTGQLQDKIEGGLASGLGIRRFQLVPSYFDRTGKTELQLTVGTDLIRNKLEVNYSSFLSAFGGQRVELEYKFNRSLSLVGSWRSVAGSETIDGQDSNDFGGDLRFHFEFE
ncbi:MAG: hypothetical protein JWQ35_2743, partial [Bacteriovoracaceae bacterium]|nr:hypothetical protein [Bacteriovoracaceae bacterium]